MIKENKYNTYSQVCKIRNNKGNVGRFCEVVCSLLLLLRDETEWI